MDTKPPADLPGTVGGLVSAVITTVISFVLLLVIALLLAWVGDGLASIDQSMDCATPACAGADRCDRTP